MLTYWVAEAPTNVMIVDNLVEELVIFAKSYAFKLEKKI